MSEKLIGAQVRFSIMHKTYSKGRAVEHFVDCQGKVSAVRGKSVIISAGMGLHNRTINEVVILDAGR